jgi:beta-N-acetylhexosaminidase
MALIIGLAGTMLSAAEREYVQRKSVAGVILFTRNFVDREQITALIQELRALRRNLLICVDQEGGRVQRFRPGFVDLPPLEQIGLLHAKRPGRGRMACKLHARIMALDMLAIGVDLSLAPVCDLARGNLAIGNRAFSEDPEICAELATLYAASMQASGMPATLKHFPGHGSIREDTHFDLATDVRAASEILRADILPFATAILAQAKAVMTAHICYPQVDREVAGYSKVWLQDILRQGLGFTGAIMSDDVGMAGGANVGSIAERVKRHYRAGCDLILVCSAEATEEAMQAKLGRRAKRGLVRSLRGKSAGRARRILSGQRWQSQLAKLTELLSEVAYERT